MTLGELLLIHATSFLGLLSRGKDSHGLRELVDSAGWEFDIFNLAELQKISSHLSELVSVIDSATEVIRTDKVGLSTLAKNLSACARPLEGIFQAIQELPHPPGLSDEALALLGQDLVTAIGDANLATVAPRLRAWLILLGAIRKVSANEITTSDGRLARRNGTRTILDPTVLADLLTNPKLVWERLFKSEAEGVRATQQLIELLGDLFEQIGPQFGFGVVNGVHAQGAQYLLTEAEKNAAKHLIVLDHYGRSEAEEGEEISNTLRVVIGCTDDSSVAGVGIMVVASGGLEITSGPVTAKMSIETPSVLLTAEGVKAQAGNKGMSFALQYDSTIDKNTPFVQLGNPGGSNFFIQACKSQAHMGLNGDAAVLEIDTQLRNVTLIIGSQDGDGFLQSVLPKDGLRIDFDFGASWSHKKGLHLSGRAELEVILPIMVNLGGVLKVDSVLLSLKIKTENDDSSFDGTIATSVILKLGPIIAAVQQMGLAARLRFPPEGGNLGIGDLNIGFKPPKGTALSIDAGVVVGGGFLFFDMDRQQYGGMIHLEIAESLNLNAIGLITTRMPDGSPGFSMLVLIAVEFAPPIQLGYGFTLNGVGGILGVNRTVAVDVLRSGLRAGTLGSILLPHDPIANAPKIISDLNGVFPPAEGRFVFGPMALLGWGPKNLIQLQLGLVLELPAPARLIILGRLRVLLPDEEHAVVKLQLDALGIIDFGNGDISLDAVLYDSEIKGFVITGEMALRANVGATPGFVLAIGGFHPAFPIPAGFPPLKRVTISLATGDNPRLRLAAYFALTTNTVQFGATFDFLLQISAFSVEGRFAFDALIQFVPFGLAASMSAMVAVKAGTTVLLAVQLDLSLTGPTPWHVWGKAHFQILFISVTVNFDATIGQEDLPPLPPPVDIRPLLIAALKEPRNWGTQLPPGEHPVVVLRQLEDQEHGLLVHPLADLHVTQQVVPLGEVITRFGNSIPEPTTPEGMTKFTLTVESAQGMVNPEPIHALFPPAQFRTMTDEEKLAAPAFDSLQSGIRFIVPGFFCGEPVVEAEMEYDTAPPKVRDPSGTTTQTIPFAMPYALTYQFVQQMGNVGSVGRASLHRSGRAKYREDVLKPKLREEIRKGKEPADFTIKPRRYKVIGFDKVSDAMPVDATLGTSFLEASNFLKRRLNNNPLLKPWLRVIPDMVEVGHE